MGIIFGSRGVLLSFYDRLWMPSEPPSLGIISYSPSPNLCSWEDYFDFLGRPRPRFDFSVGAFAMPSFSRDVSAAAAHFRVVRAGVDTSPASAISSSALTSFSPFFPRCLRFGRADSCEGSCDCAGEVSSLSEGSADLDDLLSCLPFFFPFFELACDGAGLGAESTSIASSLATLSFLLLGCAVVAASPPSF